MARVLPVQLLLCSLLISTSTMGVKLSMRQKARRMKESIEEPEYHQNVGNREEPSSCQLATWEDHLVVAARYEEDVSWLATSLNPWLPYLVFSIKPEDKNATHTTASNTGREAQAYLQFIVTYYSCLPKHMVFLHAHQASQHSEDIVNDLKRLRWDTMPGFVSVSRPLLSATFNFSNPESHKPDPLWPADIAHWSQFAYEQLQNLTAIWRTLFQAELGGPPSQLTYPMGGQFVVSRDRVLEHPLSFYKGLLEWLQNDPMDGFWAGLIFEPTWSYIFGAGADYAHPEECHMFLCDPQGVPLIPDWRLVMHLKHRPIQDSFSRQVTRL